LQITQNFIKTKKAVLFDWESAFWAA